MLDTRTDQDEPERGLQLAQSRVQVGAARPPRPPLGVVASALRHPLIVLFPIIVLTAAAMFVASRHDPTYSAKTRLQVTRLDLSAPGALSGLSTATETLAAGYARAVNADAVVGPVAQRLRLPRGQVASRVSASPVPSSPEIWVSASGPSEQSAVVLANAIAGSLTRYIAEINAVTTDVGRTYRQYKAVSAEIASTRAQYNRAQRNNPNGPAAQAASTRLRTLQLRAQALGARYQQLQANRAVTGKPTLLTRAEAATSDRQRRLQLYGFVGFVAGGLIGLALATLRANRGVRRPFEAW